MKKKELLEIVAKAAQRVADNHACNGTDISEMLCNAFRDFADAIEDQFELEKAMREDRA